MDRGTEGQRGGGTERQRDRGTEGHTDILRLPQWDVFYTLFCLVCLRDFYFGVGRKVGE